MYQRLYPWKWLFASLVLAAAVTGSATAQAQPAAPRVVSVRELAAVMTEPILVSEFRSPMKLKESLERLQQNLARRGKALPLEVNMDAFSAANPDAPDIWDTDVAGLPRHPHFLHVHQVLRIWLSQVPTQNGAFVIRPGRVEVTTQDEASLFQRTQEIIFARYERRPVLDILQTLYELTGVPVTVDPRVASQLRLPVTVNFTNEVTLETALNVLAEMAGAKMIVLDQVVYFTTPANAQQLFQEQWLRLQQRMMYGVHPFLGGREIPGPGLGLGI